MISCICPTTEARRRFLPQAFRCYNWQGADELIVVDDGESPVDLPSNVTHLVVPAGWNIGRKMNEGIEAARGDVICKWDDDDYYAPGHVMNLAGALLRHPEGSVAAVGTYLSFILEDWVLRYSGGANAFAGATLCFTRKTWEQRPFDETCPIGEDLDFVLGRNKIPVMPPPFTYVAVRHGENTWREWQGGSVEEVFRKRPIFEQTVEEFFPEEDVEFYRRLVGR